MRVRLVVHLVLISVLSVRMLAQGAKMLLIDRPLDDDPVRIVTVMEGATEVKSDGVRYPNRWVWEGVIDRADDDWLTGLSLAIRNTSAKKIVYIDVACSVTETANWRQEIAIHSLSRNKTPEPGLGQINNRVGLRPEIALYSPFLKRKMPPDKGSAFELAPGESYTIPLENPAYYPDLKSSIEEKKGSISAANGCNGGIGQIFFEDGTKWAGHHYYHAELNDPRYWVPMSSEKWASTKNQ